MWRRAVDAAATAVHVTLRIRHDRSSGCAAHAPTSRSLMIMIMHASSRHVQLAYRLRTIRSDSQPCMAICIQSICRSCQRKWLFDLFVRFRCDVDEDDKLTVAEESDTSWRRAGGRKTNFNTEDAPRARRWECAAGSTPLDPTRTACTRRMRTKAVQGSGSGESDRPPRLSVWCGGAGRRGAARAAGGDQRPLSGATFRRG